MPPKRKKSSVFAGPGRILGSGEEKPTKRPRKTVREEEDAEYTPPQGEGQESDDDDQVPKILTSKTEDGAKKKPVLTKGADLRARALKRTSRRERSKQDSHDKDKKFERAERVIETDPESEDDDSHDSDEYDDVSFGTLRSGAGRGFYKYGQGRTLGEAKAEGKDLEKDG